jgi:membrane protease YdiL (CAAX protease family)
VVALAALVLPSCRPPAAALALSSVLFGLYHRSLFPVPLLLMKMALGAMFGRLHHRVVAGFENCAR